MNLLPRESEREREREREREGRKTWAKDETLT
jgi:hypothetical protein